MKSLKLLLLLFVLPVITQAQKKTDIAYVSMEVILAQYAPAIKAMSDIESLKMQYQSTHDSLLAMIGKLHQDLNKKMESFLDAEREKAFEKIRMKEDELEKFIQSKFGEPNGELAKKTEQLMKPVRQKISAAIDQVRMQNEYKFVFNKTEAGNLISADPQYDLTFKVLNFLKKSK